MNLLSAYLTPQTMATAGFILVVALTILGALIAVGARNIFHNVLGLAVALFGVSGLFVYLNSPFVALMEILIYVGAICIAICFAVMLSEPMHLPRLPPGIPCSNPGGHRRRPGGLHLPGNAAEEDHLDRGRGTQH